MEMRVGESKGECGREGGRAGVQMWWLPAQPLEARKAGDDNEEDASSERHGARTSMCTRIVRIHCTRTHARVRARSAAACGAWPTVLEGGGGPSDCARRTRRYGVFFLCKYSRVPTMLKKVLREISTNVQLTTQETAIPNTAPPTLDSARRAFSPRAMLRWGRKK